MNHSSLPGDWNGDKLSHTLAILSCTRRVDPEVSQRHKGPGVSLHVGFATAPIRVADRGHQSCPISQRKCISAETLYKARLISIPKIILCAHSWQWIDSTLPAKSVAGYLHRPHHLLKLSMLQGLSESRTFPLHGSGSRELSGSTMSLTCESVTV